ncbi:MAG: hypothetical protein R3C28_19280 [Pirellulaceae bacterium]
MNTLLLGVMCFSSQTMGLVIYDSFDDGNLRDDSPVSWTAGVPENGDLVLRGNFPGFFEAYPSQIEPSANWSMQTQFRLGGPFYMALMADAGPVGGGFSNGWAGFEPESRLWIGSVFTWLESVDTDLRPIDEDVILQVDTFDNNYRVWAWRPTEVRPDEPLLERTIVVNPDSLPKLIVNSPGNEAPEATFRWVQFSNERSLPAPEILSLLTGDFDNNGILNVSDIELLSAAISSGANESRFDLTDDTVVNREDLVDLVTSQMGTWIGDANLDGEFNSSDMISVFSAGKYESGQTATWTEGDWNGDTTFDSADLIAAFSDGGYELGPRQAVSSVPEPSLGLWGIFAALLCVRRSCRRRLA